MDIKELVIGIGNKEHCTFFETFRLPREHSPVVWKVQYALW